MTILITVSCINSLHTNTQVTILIPIKWRQPHLVSLSLTLGFTDSGLTDLFFRGGQGMTCAAWLIICYPRASLCRSVSVFWSVERGLLSRENWLSLGFCGPSSTGVASGWHYRDDACPTHTLQDPVSQLIWGVDGNVHCGRIQVLCQVIYSIIGLHRAHNYFSFFSFLMTMS